jgi:hypothetical protein
MMCNTKNESDRISLYTSRHWGDKFTATIDMAGAQPVTRCSLISVSTRFDEKADRR